MSYYPIGCLFCDVLWVGEPHCWYCGQDTGVVGKDAIDLQTHEQVTSMGFGPRERDLERARLLPWEKDALD